MGRFDSEPPPLHYRYTVKCDRDDNRKIERAAKALGMSPTAYVQQHFDGLFASEPAPAAPAATPGASADRKKVSEHVRAALVAEIASLAGERGRPVCIALRELGERCNVSTETASRAMIALIHDNRVEVAMPGGPNKPATYRIPKVDA